MRFDAFEISEGKIVFYNMNGQTMTFEFEKEEAEDKKSAFLP
jgi:hypothetical protein